MPAPQEHELAAVFVAKARYFLREEYRTKMRRVLDALPADALWWRADESTNSIANLLLHLSGNVRQWIVGGVGQQLVTRHRAEEFSARQERDLEELWALLDSALADADAVLEKLPANTLLEKRTIQGRDVTVIEAIFHVVEHFSLHLGQIIYVAKMRAPGSIKFYEDAGGLAKPLWRSEVAPSDLSKSG